MVDLAYFHYSNLILCYFPLNPHNSASSNLSELSNDDSQETMATSDYQQPATTSAQVAAQRFTDLGEPTSDSPSHGDGDSCDANLDGAREFSLDDEPPRSLRLRLNRTTTNSNRSSPTEAGKWVWVVLSLFLPFSWRGNH